MEDSRDGYFNIGNECHCVGNNGVFFKRAAGLNSDSRAQEVAVHGDRGQVPLSIYVHLPWCVRKCPYCDFNSHAVDGVVDQSAYVDALLRDLDRESVRKPLPAVRSIFIGGGTPSLFDGAAIARLIAGIERRVPLVDGIEITLEANPGTAEAARFAAYRAAGVNRLSIGVQSLDDARLAALGRIHSAGEAVAAFEMARAAGFDNINLDMMYGLPHQSAAQAISDLRALIALGPEHLSWYQLTLEPNTLFHHRPPAGLPDDDGLGDIMDAGQALLADAGFAQYEISAYARDGRECRHNRNYWEFGDYLGIGAGAHGKLTLADRVVERTTKPRNPGDYLAGAGRADGGTVHKVSSEELPLEFMLNALRLNLGVPKALFEPRTGLPVRKIEAQIRRARARGLLCDAPERLQPTPLGQRFLNDLLAIFEPQ